MSVVRFLVTTEAQVCCTITARTCITLHVQCTSKCNGGASHSHSNDTKANLTLRVGFVHHLGQLRFAEFLPLLVTSCVTCDLRFCLPSCSWRWVSSSYAVPKVKASSIFTSFLASLCTQSFCTTSSYLSHHAQCLCVLFFCFCGLCSTDEARIRTSKFTLLPQMWPITRACITTSAFLLH